MLLQYLADQLEIPVPASILQSLRTAGSDADSLAREVLLRGVMATRGGAPNPIGIGKGWWHKVVFRSWLLFPSPAYLLETEKIVHRRVLPAFYLRRSVKLVRSLWFAARRAVGRQSGRVRKKLGPPAGLAKR
jgi:hypothetical protein